MAEERRYDDREVGLILKRVAELHGRQSEVSDPHAMTRGEIEEVVTELGISKALVAQAVAEVSVQDVRNQSVWWLGGKTDVMFERIVPGTVDEATMTRMIEVLRRYLGDPGEVQVEGSARIWSTSGRTSRRIHFSVVEHGDETTLRLEERMPVDARTTVGTSTFAGGFAGFLGILPLKVLVGKAVLLLAMGPVAGIGATVGWLAGRALWRRRSAQREGALHSAFGEILSIALGEAGGAKALGEAGGAKALPEAEG